MNEARLRRLRELVNAHKLIESSTISYDAALREMADLEAIERWLWAEQAHLRKVENWLDAEKRFKTKQWMDALKFSDQTYAAAKRGWQMVKHYVPNQDGVDSFDKLPDSLQFRYAAFASAVLGLLPPAEVKSQKQELRGE